MKYLLLAVLLMLPGLPAFAQGDLQAERASLRGITSFYVDVTVEGPKQLVASESLVAATLIQRVEKHLAGAGLPVRPRVEGPHLHLHVNMMEVEGGLLPFSLNAHFYQPVRLERNREIIAAATWDEGVVGLVSQDRIPLILESLNSLVDQFASDFGTANR
jgi:hypothetical protein